MVGSCGACFFVCLSLCGSCSSSFSVFFLSFVSLCFSSPLSESLRFPLRFSVFVSFVFSRLLSYSVVLSRVLPLFALSDFVRFFFPLLFSPRFVSPCLSSTLLFSHLLCSPVVSHMSLLSHLSHASLLFCIRLPFCVFSFVILLFFAHRLSSFFFVALPLLLFLSSLFLLSEHRFLNFARVRSDSSFLFRFVFFSSFCGFSLLLSSSLFVPLRPALFPSSSLILFGVSLLLFRFLSISLVHFEPLLVTTLFFFFARQE